MAAGQMVAGTLTYDTLMHTRVITPIYQPGEMMKTAETLNDRTHYIISGII